MQLLLIEDEPGVANFLKRGFADEKYNLDHAADGLKGEELALTNTYDVIILDLILPGKDGREVCRSLRANGIKTPIIMLTALGSTDEIIAGLDIGADDYLKKPFRFSELLARVRAVSRRATTAPLAGQLSIADLKLDLATREVFRGDTQIKLTAREFSLLEFLLRNQKRVVSRLDILEQVWDITFNPGTNVIDVYINYLRNKVDKPFDVKLIHTVTGAGFILKEE